MPSSRSALPLQPLLDAILFDIGGTLVEEAPAGTPTDDLQAILRPRVLPDLHELVGGVQLGAVTNTAVMTETDVRALLAPVGLDDLLEVVVTSSDVGVAKPDPAPLREAMRRLGLDDPGRILFVGDLGSDELAAREAGMPYVDIARAPDGTIAAALSAWLDERAGAGIERARADVVPVDESAAADAAQLHQSLTKPPGSLGRIEGVGIQLAAIAGSSPPPLPHPAAVVVFAADHGVVARGVSSWPQEVTAQMVANFDHGSAAINVLARQIGAAVTVVDIGVAQPLAWSPAVLRRAVRRGTDDLSVGAAMSRRDALLALDVGVELADRCVREGARALITGDMGIGNTTASAALIAAITGTPAADVTGRGAGADDLTLVRKVAAISDALERVQARPSYDPVALLAELGGLEIAGLAGFIVGGAAHRVPIVVDGVIAGAALLVADLLAPHTTGYVIAGHRSVEPGAAATLAHLGLEPLLDLDLRLGEGSGAALAVPLIHAAASVLSEMATFDAAGVTDKH